MQEELNYRLKRLEEQIQNMLLTKMKQKRDKNCLTRSSCPASCEYVSKPCNLSASKSFLSKSLSAPSNSTNKRSFSKKKMKNNDRLREPTKVSNTILNYIENLEKSLSRKVDEDSMKTCESLCSKTCSNVTYEQSLICGNVLIASPFDGEDKEKKEKSTKQIKKELTKIKHQLNYLEDTKRDAIEITKKVISKRDDKRLNEKTMNDSNYFNKGNTDENKSQSTHTESQTIKVCESSQTSEFDLINKITQKDELIKTLKESNKSLYQNLKQQEEKVAHLTKSLQSSQAQLRENRKSFQKYENLLEENMMLSMKINEFQQSFERKDETNKKILQAAEELANDLYEGDKVNKRLNDKIVKLEENLIDLGERNKKLIEENNELCQKARDKEEKYADIKNKYDDVEKKIDTFKDQMQKSQLEIGRLRQMVSNHGRQELTKEKDMEELQEQLKEYKRNETKLIDEVKCLMKQVRMFKAEKEMIGEKLENELQKLDCKAQKSQGTITDFKDTNCQQPNSQQLNTCEEIIQIRQTLSDNEKHLVKEKFELKGLVQELTNIIKTQKDRIGDLSNFNRQQEQMLDIQKKSLNSKELEIEESRKNVQQMIFRCKNLEDEVNELKSELNKLNETKKENDKENTILVDNSINVLVKKLEDTVSTLNNERDALRIKDKIIESQTVAINELKLQIKYKNDEINRADMQLKRLLIDFNLTSEESERIRVELDEEKKTKELMYDDIERLQMYKEDLLRKFSQLEVEFTNYYRRANAGDADINNQEEIIENLQIKLKEQETEWLNNSQMLLYEKEKAVQTAKFATQKLVDTVDDFQKQVDAHQHIQKLLTTLLHEKDEQIRHTLTNMNKMTTELSRTQLPIMEYYQTNAEQLKRQYSCDSIDNDTIKPNKDHKKEMNMSNLKSSGDCWTEDTSQFILKECEEKSNHENYYQSEWITFENDALCDLEKIRNALQATSLTSVSQNKLQISILSNSNLYKNGQAFPWYSQNHSSSQTYEDVQALTGDESLQALKSYPLSRNVQISYTTPSLQYEDTDENYAEEHGMQEVEEIFVRQHVEPKINWSTNFYQHNITDHQTKPIRYFSLLKKDKM